MRAQGLILAIIRLGASQGLHDTGPNRGPSEASSGPAGFGHCVAKPKKDQAPRPSVNRILVAFCVLAVALPGCLNDLGTTLVGDRPDPYDYISSRDYDRLVVEIDYVAGKAPPQSAINMLNTRLGECLDKPGGIVVRLGDEIPGGASPYTLDEMLGLRDQWKDAKHGDGQASAWIVYLDGRYSESDSVLGVAFGGDTVAIFSDRVSAASNVLVSTSKIHEAVLVHEFGHLLGLVDNGIPMVSNHEDSQNQGHSNNRNSVMYWAVETFDIVGLIQNGGIPNRFDSADKADLANAGGICGNASEADALPGLPPLPPL